MTLLPLTPEQNNILCEMAKYAIEHCDEVDIPIEQFIHEGVYYRTCKVPKDVAIIGALIKIPTTVIVSGDCYVTLGNTVGRLEGYSVIKAEAGRRQAFRAVKDITSRCVLGLTLRMSRKLRRSSLMSGFS